jgi:hypothetical protein
VVAVQRLLAHRNHLHAARPLRNVPGRARLHLPKVHRPVFTSPLSLRFFLLLITIAFVAELTAAIVVFATGDKIIDEVIDRAQAQNEWERLKDNLMLVNYFVIGTIAVEFLLAVLVKCYIGSLREKNSAYDYRVVDEEGNKMSLQEKRNNDSAKIQEKYSKKREEMHQKYGYGNSS